MEIPAPTLEPLCEFLVELGSPIELGDAPRGGGRPNETICDYLVALRKQREVNEKQRTY